MTNTFGNELKKLRIEKGITVRRLGLRSGLNYSYISQIENGHRPISSITTLKKLAHGFGIPMSIMLKMAGYSPSTDVVDLDSDFRNHKKFIYKGKPVSKETLKYVKRLLGNC